MRAPNSTIDSMSTVFPPPTPNLNAPLPPLPTTSSFHTYLSAKAHDEYNAYRASLDTIRTYINNTNSYELRQCVKINLAQKETRFQLQLANALFYLFDALAISVPIPADGKKPECGPRDRTSLDWVQGFLHVQLGNPGLTVEPDLNESARVLDLRGEEALREEVVAFLDKKALAYLDAEMVGQLRGLRQNHDRELRRVRHRKQGMVRMASLTDKLEPWVDEVLEVPGGVVSESGELKRVVDRFAKKFNELTPEEQEEALKTLERVADDEAQTQARAKDAATQVDARKVAEEEEAARRAYWNEVAKQDRRERTKNNLVIIGMHAAIVACLIMFKQK